MHVQWKWGAASEFCPSMPSRNILEGAHMLPQSKLMSKLAERQYGNDHAHALPSSKRIRTFLTEGRPTNGMPRSPASGSSLPFTFFRVQARLSPAATLKKANTLNAEQVRCCVPGSTRREQACKPWQERSNTTDRRSGIEAPHAPPKRANLSKAGLADSKHDARRALTFLPAPSATHQEWSTDSADTRE